MSGDFDFVDSEDLMSWLLLNQGPLDSLAHDSFDLFEGLIPGNLELPSNDILTAPSLNAALEPGNNCSKLVDVHSSIDHSSACSTTFESASSKTSNPLSSNIQNQSSGPNRKKQKSPRDHLNNENPGNFIQKASQNESLKQDIVKTEGENGNKRHSRKRSLESVDELESRVKALQSENADLHAHLLNVTQRTTEVQKQRNAMEKLMMEKLFAANSLGPSDQRELAEIVKQYTDIYADYGKCRQREVAFHLQQIENLIIPTKTTKMCLWTLQQDNSFYQSNRSPMYDILSKELEITHEQTVKIQERREKTFDLLAQLKECLDLLKQLKESIEVKHSCYDGICGRVQAASSPMQTVKFLLWINTHSEQLAKFLSGFCRNVHHIPRAEFVNESNSDSLGNSI